MLPILERALHKIDQLPIKADGSPRDVRDSVVGTWQLDNALSLAVEAVSEAAAYSGQWLTYDQLQKSLNAKRLKPHPDDPEFDPPDVTYDTSIERTVARQVRYRRALKAYEADVRETETVRRQFGYGQRNYLAYAQHAVERLVAGDKGTRGVPNPLTQFLHQPRSLPIPEASTQYGTFIVGNHGSGKSEVIKQRIWHYLNKPVPEETIVVIDPHGQMAPEIARMKPNFGSDRLVYLDPTLEAGFMPCPEFLQSQAGDVDGIYKEATHYGEALRMMAGSVEPSASGNMEALCQYCAYAILEHDQYHLRDLLALLNTVPHHPKHGEPDYPQVYLDACQSQNPEIAEHFKRSFLHRRNYTAAKDALATRIERIIASPVLQRMLFNPPSFNMGGLIEQRKVIVIRLPFDTLTTPVTRMIAQLFMAQITLAILARDVKRIDQYHPVHVFVDEAQHVASPATATAINEFRKYRFDLTLATQYTEQLPSSILEAVKGLGVQIAGFCTGKNLETMNAVFDLSHKSKDLDETTVLQNQTVGEFHLRARGADGAPPISTRQFVTDTNLLTGKSPWAERNAARFMTDEEWAETKQWQLDTYYRAVGSGGRASTVSSAPKSPSRPARTPTVKGKLNPGRGYD